MGLIYKKNEGYSMKKLLLCLFVLTGMASQSHANDYLPETVQTVLQNSVLRTGLWGVAVASGALAGMAFWDYQFPTIKYSAKLWKQIARTTFLKEFGITSAICIGSAALLWASQK